ncbi:HAD family hydrolase [Streptomyces sp. PT12]|uniref:HAD family hydrolase n=1 Tax=Streptomyces sp. PT12 TaxID=1510197 RepID=UPI0015EED960|nr:HAD-IA family hydrolase [Streptomyces sp. PT12]
MLFDAADTLFTLSPSLPELVTELVGSHGGPWAPDRIGRAFDGLGPFDWPDDQPTHDARLCAWAAFVEGLLEASGIEGIDAARPAIARAAAAVVTQPRRYGVFPDVAPVLDLLAASGLPVGIVSNFDELLFDILRATGLDSWFPVVVTSYRTGVPKPDPLIFGEALRRTGMDPARTYHVGDSLHSDMGGARAAGLRGVLLDRTGAHPGYAGARIASLLDLPALLGLGTPALREEFGDDGGGDGDDGGHGGRGGRGGRGAISSPGRAAR